MRSHGKDPVLALWIDGGAGRIRRFVADTRGTLAIFGLMLFLLMIMMGGIAVDLMRYESTRTSLQNTLDRSTLAAASLTQQLDPESVVNDYFLKAGLAEYLRSVVVDEGANYRMVTADAVADARPMFMQLLGINQFDANGHSRAEQRIDNVEIALALDISGSMQGTKISSLIDAANEFVDTVLNSDPDQHISIGIVPYNAQVNLPASLVSQFNVTHDNGVADDNCLELPPSVFTTTGISTTLELPMMAYADIFSSTRRDAYFYPVSTQGRPRYSSAYCKQDTMNQVLLPTKDAAALHAKINSLQAAGNTSIMYGMRWALELLDPSARDIFTNLIAAGDMSAALAGHPYDYSDTETLKVIVLMTDGEHTQHESINDPYKTGPSPIYKSTGDSNYSIQFTSGRPASAGANEYWVPHLSTWRSAPWDSGAGTVQMDWRDIWATFSESYLAWQFYARALGTTSTSRNSVYSSTIDALEDSYGATTTMDSQLQQVCATAKDNRVVVYGIAFEAPTNGQFQISSCATSGAHYFNATSVSIGTAFKAIANNISQLRLTQ